MLNLYHPISHGHITNWDEMEKIWRCSYIFKNQLQVDPPLSNVLMSEPISIRNHSTSKLPIRNSEMMMQIIFETYNFRGFFILLQPNLALYDSCRTSGIVLESGDGITQVFPMIEGRIMTKALACTNLAGSDVTTYLQEETMRNQTINQYIPKSYFNSIKENHAYVALDYNLATTTT
ncbi:actin [Histomonas meleagridis]|uniref:actin n=1 Tax=Histomonas meleagridis TaxID=135588 RepID=UPI003559FFFE|nr:actin [Histomonas meleagridis]KAH0800132.1 actin [Histomonas meleagridis]